MPVGRDSTKGASGAAAGGSLSGVFEFRTGSDAFNGGAGCSDEGVGCSDGGTRIGDGLDGVPVRSRGPIVPAVTAQCWVPFLSEPRFTGFGAASEGMTTSAARFASALKRCNRCRRKREVI
jgi:hypothetical protein